MSHTDEDTQKGAIGGTVSASGKGSEPKEKRAHTEMVDSSIGDEFASIQKQLDQMCNDMHQTREELKNLMSKKEMKDFITSTVEKITKAMKTQLETQFAAKIETEVKKKLDEKITEKMDEMNDRMDTLTLENVHLREEMDKLKKQVNENERIAKAAMQKANMNEQYSRKNNIKIMGVAEDGDETEDRLTKNVKHILESKAGISLDESKITAIHRIPGKIGMPKPVLLKLRNNSEKARIMKKRKEMKLGGYRLVDDVTKENTKLINRLNLHKDIDSAWYFNGSVYGKSTAGRRFRFDLYSDIDEVVESKKKAESGGSTGVAAEPMDLAAPH